MKNDIRNQFKETLNEIDASKFQKARVLKVVYDYIEWLEKQVEDSRMIKVNINDNPEAMKRIRNINKKRTN